MRPSAPRADDPRLVVREDARHRRQVADVLVSDMKQAADGFLVGGDAIEVAHGSGSIRAWRGRRFNVLQLGFRPSYKHAG